MENLLFLVSQNWSKRNDGDFAIIVFHSCETGKGENSFAQILSKSEEFKNVLIIAPSENVVIINKEEKGV